MANAWATATSSAEGAWYVWTRSTASSTATTTDPWPDWCGNSTTSSTVSVTSSSETTWLYWSQDGGYQVTPPARAETEEARVERLRLAEESAARWKAKAEEEKKAREAAEARAEALLVENLSEEQRADYRKHRHFVVHGRRARYRIRYGRSGNIDVVGRDGKIVHRLCAHPLETVPNPDTMLAQKLMLEHDEDGFERLANRHHIYDGPAAVLPALH